MRKLFTAFVLAAILSGCGIAYESNKRALLKDPNLDYGPPPPADYQDIEKQAILGFLKDPESARFKFYEPRKEIVMQGMGKAVTAWVTKVDVNAKNSYGGYVGFTPYLYAWKDGKVIAKSGEVAENGQFFWIEVK